MEDNTEGPKFLKKMYGLHARPEVKAAAKRTEARTGTPVPNDPEALIKNYADRFREILDRTDPKKRERGITALKKVLTDKYVVRVEDIPNSYWQAQLRVLRNRGEKGDLQDKSEEALLKAKREHLSQVKEDQKGSLEEWIDYLSFERSSYLPDHLKYWIFSNILKLERYKKGKDDKPGRFPKRPSGKQRSIKMFPEVNEHGLKFIAKAFKNNTDGSKISFPYDIPRYMQPEFRQALDKKDFRAIYGWTQEYIPPISDAEMQTTEGEWVTYSRGSDAETLSKTLHGKGSGWCIAGAGIAGEYLKRGDLYIYYTRDDNDEPTIPRIVIVEKNGKVVEVKGIEWEENVDSYIKDTDIIGEKLREIPGGDEFYEVDADTKHLTEIDHKISANVPLTKEELAFLYEIDRPIKYFGVEKDPRIEELRAQRNLQEDFRVLYPHLVSVGEKTASEIPCTREELTALWETRSSEPFSEIIGSLLARRNAEQDMPVVFDCRPDQIARTGADVRPDTKAYVGKLSPEVVRQLHRIEYVYTSFPERRIERETLKIGGRTRDKLIEEMKRQDVIYEYYVRDMLQSSDFTTLSESEDIDLIRLSVGDLGFRDYTTTQELFEKAAELGLEPVPAETGPYYRLKHMDQPDGDWVYMGMNPITDREGYPYVFGVGVYWDGGRRWLREVLAYRDTRWGPSYQFVFRLRKLESSTLKRFVSSFLSRSVRFLRYFDTLSDKNFLYK